jgi:uncharacterized protein (TIGR03643 family)
LAQKKRLNSYCENDLNRLVEMAWSDRISFDEIQRQYGISENQLKKLMRRLIQRKSYKRWRRRVQGRKSKHRALLE